jgi:hypothetical protein
MAWENTSPLAIRSTETTEPQWSSPRRRSSKSKAVDDDELLSSLLLDKDQSLSRTRNPHAVGNNGLVFIEDERLESIDG